MVVPVSNAGYRELKSPSVDDDTRVDGDVVASANEISTNRDGVENSPNTSNLFACVKNREPLIFDDSRSLDRKLYREFTDSAIVEWYGTVRKGDFQ